MFSLDKLKARHSTGLHKLENLRRGDTTWPKRSCPYLLFDGGKPKFVVDPACICTSYYSTKTCAYGIKCRYWHVLPDESRGYVSGPEPGSSLPGEVLPLHQATLATRTEAAAGRIATLKTALAAPYDSEVRVLEAQSKAVDVKIAQAYKKRKLIEDLEEKKAQVEAMSTTKPATPTGGSSSSSSSKVESIVVNDSDSDLGEAPTSMEAAPTGSYLDPQSYEYESHNRGIYNSARPVRYKGNHTADLAAFKGPAFSNAHQYYKGRCCGCRKVDLNYMTAYLCPLCCTSIFCDADCAKKYGHPGRNFICTPHPRYPFVFE